MLICNAYLFCVQESPQVQPPLSESMIQLMRRLDQLNMDIEEALSAGSSPSDTPNTARRHLAMMNDESTLQVICFAFSIHTLLP